MKKTSLLWLTLFLSALSLQLAAEPENPQQAFKKASQFYSEKLRPGLRSTPKLRLVHADSLKLTNYNQGAAFAAYYVFNFGDNDGFVIVSGDDLLQPVLAYAKQGSFRKDNLPDNLASWLDFYSNEIEYTLGNERILSTLRQKEDFSPAGLRSGSAVAPLLGSIAWNQDDPYNQSCPISSHYSERTVTGCVATAMAQIMKYHEWPVTGAGSNSYTWSYTNQSETLSANFAATTYDWGNMLDSYGPSANVAQENAVATLMYHCGVSVNMNYGIAATGGSGTATSNAGIALRTYFGYDTDMQVYRREFYLHSQWAARIKEELDAGRPILYSGRNDNGGHAFVCDGYDEDDFFHFNWGWGGYSNGYFALNVLDPNYSGIGSSSGGYSQQQYAVMGIQPEDSESNPNAHICIYENSLSSNKSSISNISPETADISFGFLNRGINTIAPIRFKLSLYQNDAFIKTIGSAVQFASVGPNQGSTGYTFTNRSFEGTSPGDYSLVLDHSIDAGSTWTAVQGNHILKNSLDVTILQDNSATIASPDYSPDLSLASAIQVDGTVYNSAPASFTASVSNLGYEYYSYMTIKLYDPSNPSTYQYLDNVLVLVPQGDTVEVEFSGNISLNPGTYEAIVMYDATNNFSKENYTAVSLSSYSALTVTVEAALIPALSLTSQISLVGGGATLYHNVPAQLQAVVQNTGGTYYGRILAFIYLSTGGSSLGYFGLLTITQNTGTVTYTLNGTFDLEPGAYFLRLCYESEYGSNSWIEFPPSSALARLNVAMKHLNTWTGSVSSNWNTQGNWSLNAIPYLSDYDVLIPADVDNAPVIAASTSASLNSITVKPKAELTIESGASLSLSGNLKLEADATGTATLIDNGTLSFNVGGSPQMQQYLTAGDTENSIYRYWYVSSPVTGADNTVFRGNGANTNYQFWTFNEANQPNPYANEQATLTEAKAYVVRVQSDRTVQLNGTAGSEFNTGSVAISLTNNNDPTHGGFNLIGNPYPSYLNWNAAANASVSSIWYRSYNATNKEMVFDTYNGLSQVGTNLSGHVSSGLIPPMQAFWVYTPSAYTLNLDNSMRAHADQASNLLRSANTQDRQLIRLRLSRDVYADETVILFDKNASDDYDAYDSPKMPNNNSLIPELFTCAGSKELSINGLSSIDWDSFENETERELALGFRTAEAGEFVIEASELLGFSPDYTCLLIDKELRIEQDLATMPSYRFSSDAVNDNQRFSLIIKRKVTGLSTVERMDFEARVINNEVLEVKLHGLDSHTTVFELYYAGGGTVFITKAAGNLTTVNTELPAGVYLLLVHNKEYRGVKRIIITK